VRFCSNNHQASGRPFSSALYYRRNPRLMSSTTDKMDAEPREQAGIPVQSIVAGSVEEPTVQHLYSLKGRAAVSELPRSVACQHDLREVLTVLSSHGRRSRSRHDTRISSFRSRCPRLSPRRPVCTLPSRIQRAHIQSPGRWLERSVLPGTPHLRSIVFTIYAARFAYTRWMSRRSTRWTPPSSR
jgi:hypothetical protein